MADAPGRKRPREIAISRTRTLHAPPAVAWGVLADTNRWDRLVGWTPTTYTARTFDPALPRVRIGQARYLGIPVHFLERGEFWAGRHLRGERRFVGPFGRVWRHAFLEAHVAGAPGDATLARLRVGIAPAGILGWLTAPVVLLHMALMLALYVRAADRALRRGQSVLSPATTRDDDPAAAQARRALFAAGGGEATVTGRRHRGSRSALRARAARLADAPVDDAVKRRLVEHLAGQPDEALVQIAPFEVARAWGHDRREVLRGFLHATRAGLYDLAWQIDCPRCRVGAATVPHLDAVGRRIHCDQCDVSYDVDFADHVHATFSANPAIRPVEPITYCAASPFHRPHVHGSLAVAIGETRTASPLPDDDLLLRALGSDRSLRLDASRVRQGVSVQITADAIHEVAGEVAPGALRVDNASGARAQLSVERSGWAADIARGSLLVTLPDFIELFGVEAPAAGLPLSVGTLAIVFTDVVGSTELYHRHGDARAYAVIQEHWREAERLAAAANGAVIKTLGDGVMASFPTLRAAVGAALAMMEHAETLSEAAGMPFAIRAGAHEGACYAVRANDRLDLFGTTVNTAARLAAIASGNQLALVAAALEVPGVSGALTAAGCSVDRVQSALRGLPGEHALAIASRPDAAVLATGRHPRVRIAEP